MLVIKYCLAAAKSWEKEGAWGKRGAAAVGCGGTTTAGLGRRTKGKGAKSRSLGSSAGSESGSSSSEVRHTGYTSFLRAIEI